MADRADTQGRWWWCLSWPAWDGESVSDWAPSQGAAIANMAGFVAQEGSVGAAVARALDRAAAFRRRIAEGYAYRPEELRAYDLTRARLELRVARELRARGHAQRLRRRPSWRRRERGRIASECGLTARRWGL